ncbi:MAG TPA: lactate racemase domain-containing protein [Verrucomicrobiae bacterium]|nr:lactate racemase domain-containing protein [Verrucomicrobiae bacterium]
MSASVPFPRMFAVRQKFPASRPPDIPAVIRSEFESSGVLARVKPGARIAVGVGSRGITNLPKIVAAVLDNLRAAGAQPFIIPAMGSHGGATPEGQRGILEEYGVSEKAMGVPIKPSLDVERIGETEDGVQVFCSVEALRSDGIVIVNRVKPHTDFSGTHGSGVLKMIVIGLGKRTGAAMCHGAAARLGYERVIRSVARVTLGRAPILCGVAIVENQFHDTARLAVLKPGEIDEREKALLEEARRLMPRLPFDDIDLLIVDRIGKNISGSGMDPNVTGRWVHGYSTSLADDNKSSPRIRRIFVRDLTPETHGNAIGIGFADMTTTRLVNAMDKQVTYINALTSLTPNGAKIPIHFDTDRECITHALASLALPDPRRAKVVRIADTLSLVNLQVSEAYGETVKQRADLEALGSAGDTRFDAGENLPPLS